MAEIVITAAVTVLLEKLASVDFMNLARSEGIKNHLKNWRINLTRIQAVLHDAAQQQITKKRVELWLLELQDLAYDIDDVLDDMATEVIRRKFSQESHASSSTNKVLKIIPTCCNFPLSNIKYGRELSSKLDKITSKLQELVEQQDKLGLEVSENVIRPNRSSRQEQTSVINDSFRIVGREGDKKKLLGSLLGDEPHNQNVGVLSVVGLGGVGKTTLTKGLYNDMKVKAKFDLRAWVCISDDFNVFNISMAIFQAVGGEDKSFANLDQLHVALKEKLTKKRFILVLDDVWNEDYNKWEVLRSPLGAGAPGSKIVVTTRSHTVASMMDSYETHKLGVLSYEKSLSLFAQSALDEQNFDKHPKLKLHGEGIVKKCDGLPLALITLGRALRMKKDDGDHDDDVWEKVLYSEIWDLKDAKDILPALRLSYYDLAPHLKHLFAYCSLFPKDFVYYKNKVVKLWLAEGFLDQKNGNMSKESLGCQYFEELQSRLFFQPSTGDKAQYIMHDLINDLAKSVAGEFFIRLDAKMGIDDRIEALVKFRHFSFLGGEDGVFRKFMELERAKCLRTFMKIHGWPPFSFSSIVLQELLPQLNFVRVLSLDGCHIGEVPYSIGCLKHLRYLNLCSNPIKQLPEQVTDLYNLQTLLISWCLKLSILPKSFAKLKHLRHLDISRTPLLTKTPLGLNGLTSLQTLSKVIIEGDNGFKISDLKDLANLQGPLSIKGLDKVINPIQAKDASLNQKKGLCDLEMIWANDASEGFEMPCNRVLDVSFNETTEYEVLQGLKPHHKLRNLKILFYGGKQFPSWVGDPLFDQLRELTLRGCIGCEQLPTLGHLQSLQMLYVESLNEVVTLDSMFCAHTNSVHQVAFPSLTVLKFKHMPRWERWSTSVGGNNATSGLFPRLGEIYIEYCPKLAELSIDLLPSLQGLHITECSEMVLRSMVCASSSIMTLILQDIKGLTHLHTELLRHLRTLKYLRVTCCKELRYLWESASEACKLLVSLQRFHIGSCLNVVTLEAKGADLGICMESLREVTFHNCSKLKSYSCPNSVERLFIRNCNLLTSLNFSTVSGIPSFLKNLVLKECHNLRSFGEGCFVHLTRVSIIDCDNIESIEGGFGFLPLSCLKAIRIKKCKNLKSFPHEHLQSLTSLIILDICACPSLDFSFPGGSWLHNLTSLSIGCLKNPISDWGLQHLPDSLDHLCLYGQNSGVKSFGFLLPPSLTSLEVYDFEDLESISDVLPHLTCLQKLSIGKCPKLKDLPETTSSLSVYVR